MDDLILIDSSLVVKAHSVMNDDWWESENLCRATMKVNNTRVHCSLSQCYTRTISRAFIKQLIFKRRHTFIHSSPLTLGLVVL